VTLWGRTSAWLRIDTCVVDDSIHAPNRVYLFGDASRLLGAAQVPDHEPGGTRSQVTEDCSPYPWTRVQDHLVPLIQKMPRRCPAKSIRTARDEDNGHLNTPLQPHRPAGGLVIGLSALSQIPQLAYLWLTCPRGGILRTVELRERS
jgi:hypothetical protein